MVVRLHTKPAIVAYLILYVEVAQRVGSRLSSRAVVKSEGAVNGKLVVREC